MAPAAADHSFDIFLFESSRDLEQFQENSSREAGKFLVISIASAIYSRKAKACSIKNLACSSPLLP
jgi:hypothetical protein